MPNQNDNLEVQHDPAVGRFELRIDGEIAVLEYIRRGRTLIFTHTGVPPALEGRGIGSRLARAGLDHARSNNLAVVPLCSFIAAYIQRHPETQDLLEKNA